MSDLVDWLIGPESLAGGVIGAVGDFTSDLAEDIGMGDLAESIRQGDLVGIGTLGLSRGLGRQLESISEDVAEWAEPGIKAITGETAAEAAEKAAKMQESAALEAIGEQRRQFDVTTELLADYVGLGKDAISSYRALSGMGTPEEQAEAIAMLKQSPEFQALTETGEEAILSTASATGNLRGGNVKAALAQYRPQVLADLINRQLGSFGGAMQIGQKSAARTGTAGQQVSKDIANIYGDIGQFRAGGELASNKARLEGIGNLFDIAGMGAQGLGLLFGGGF